MPDNNELVEHVVSEVRKRGSKSASIEHNNTATKEEIKGMISNVLYWYKRPIVKTDEECAERLNEFFSHVNETGEIPTVEKMCLALGTTRQTVYRWEQGELNNVRRDMIKKAKEILAAIDAELVSRNKIPTISYIFRAKNFYGMADQTNIVLTPDTPLQHIDADESRKRLTSAIPDDE